MVERLKKSLLYTYGIADLAFVLMVNMEVYFFPAFLTDHAQFSLSLSGRILGITSAIDIVFALVAGILLQKLTLKFGGKYRSWFLVGPPVVAALFLLQFTKIGSDSIAATIIILGFISSHLIWNIVVTAGGSMVGRLSHLPNEQTILSTSRAQGISVAGLIFSATAVPMMLFFSTQTSDIVGITITVGVYSVLMIFGYWYIYRMTAGRDPYDEADSDSVQGNAGPSIWSMLVLPLKNPPLMLLIVAEIFRNSYVLIITAYAHYYFKYVLNEYALMSYFILAISIARLSGTVVASWIGIRIGKRNTYWMSLIAAAVGFGAAVFCSENAWSFTLVFCIASMLGMIAGSMSTALFSDTVVYGEWKTGRNMRAFTIALQSFAIKVAVLIRNAVVALGLSAIGFIANATDPASGVIEGIRSIMIFAPAAACTVAALLFFLGYKIEDSHVLRMQEEIVARRADAS